MRSALDLMRLHLDAVYLRDAAGRLVAMNDRTKRRPPRLWIGRTAEGDLRCVRDDVPDEAIETLSRADHGVSGPTFWLPDHIELAGSSAVLLDSPEPLAGGLEPWMPDVAHCRPFAASLVDGRAVAVCASVRITPAAHEAGVETHPDFRRRGHAAQAVRRWAAEVRRLGAVPLYSARWDNTASRALAAAIGFVAYGSELRVR